MAQCEDSQVGRRKQKRGAYTNQHEASLGMYASGRRLYSQPLTAFQTAVVAAVRNTYTVYTGCCWRRCADSGGRGAGGRGGGTGSQGSVFDPISQKIPEHEILPNHINARNTVTPVP